MIIGANPGQGFPGHPAHASEPHSIVPQTGTKKGKWLLKKGNRKDNTSVSSDSEGSSDSEDVSDSENASDSESQGEGV